jgi:hypothetical protein
VSNTRADATERHAHRARWWVLGAVAVMMFSTWAGLRFHLRHQIGLRLDQIRAQGLPATLEELNHWYATPPPGHNAADIYLDAVAMIRGPDGEQAGLVPLVGVTNLPPSAAAIPADMLQAMAAWLEENREASARFRDATALSQSRYPVDFRDGIGIATSHLGQLRSGARFLALQAVYHAERGDAAQTVESLTDGFALAESLAWEPILVSQLFRFDCHMIALAAMERALNRTQFDDDGLRELGAAVPDSEAPSGTQRGYVGQRCFVDSIFAMQPREIAVSFYGSSGRSFDREVLLIHALRFSGLWDMDRLTALDFSARYIEAADHESTTALDEAQRLHDKVGRLRFPHVMTQILMSHTWRFDPEARQIALARCGRTAVAVERYRLAHGRLPENLAELVPAQLETVPLDPFDGRPLRYKRLSPGYVVYSVGFDRVDDGGVDDARVDRYDIRRPYGPDITFRVER